MAFIVYQTNKKTGAVYAYRQEAYRDPETKRPKSRKTYLGRVDPVTKEIIPKGTGGLRGQSGQPSGSTPEDSRRLERMESEINSLKDRLEEVTATLGVVTKSLQDLAATIGSLKL